MSGFNRLWDLFMRPVSITTDPARHYGWGAVNQWFDMDNREIGKALRKAGCTATRLDFTGPGTAQRWKDMNKCFAQAERAHKDYINEGQFVNWEIVNANIGGGGVPENGSVSVCSLPDEWYWPIVDFFEKLLKNGDGSVLPFGELGCRNKQCRDRLARLHNATLERLGRAKVRWNGNGNARPTSGPGVLEYHPSKIADTGYAPGTLVVPDHSVILNELGGLRSHVSNHYGLRKCVLQARRKGCGFVHYMFGGPGIDYAAIEIIGNAAKENI